MPKYLKKYNKESKKWEIVSEPKDATIIQYIDETAITDENVIVQNINYAKSGDTTLNETFNIISDDISRLQRNVSWLAEHGGGGGGGGTGSTSYGIVVTSPELTNGVYYTSESSLTVVFSITGGTTAETCQYRYIYDGTYTSEYSGITCNTSTSIKITDINMVSTGTTHSFKLEATSPYGMTIIPFSFKIYEDTLALSIDTEKNKIKNGEILVNKNVIGTVYFKIKNGVEGADTKLIEKFQGATYETASYKSTSSIVSVGINVWEVLGTSVQVGEIYTVYFYAQSVYNEITKKTEQKAVSIRVTSNDEMLIYFDGLTYTDDVETGLTEATTFANDENLRFSFTVSLPSTIKNEKIYYAAKLFTPNDLEGEIIIGQSWDNYSVNVSNIANQDIVISYSLYGKPVSNGWKIIIKAWDYDGQIYTTKSGTFDITESNNDIYPRQFNKREETSSKANTCLFSWGNNSKIATDKSKWISEFDYIKIQGGNLITATTYLIPYNTNGRDSGFITSTTGHTYLRLQNGAYAIGDVTNYQSEIDALNNNTLNINGFTISITFETDVHADTEKTVFLWGFNNSDGSLGNGMRIDVEKAMWCIHTKGGIENTISAYIRQGKRNTVDFSYRNKIAYIYVNGVISGAYKTDGLNIDDLYKFSNFFYFGTNVINNEYTNSSDVKIYDCSLYTFALNPLQITVNGKNARIDNASTEVIEEYKTWKRSNLIYNVSSDTATAKSYLIDSNGEFSYDQTSFQSMQEYSNIPIITINANGSTFTEEIFHKDYSGEKSITASTFDNCKLTYYEPNLKKNIEFKVKIALQGTSTLAYYVKNLEVIIDEQTSYDTSKNKLFQPKNNWFPEKEFTLKADIVDSSHANNATIGKWINESGIMDNNPAMDVLENDSYRPLDKTDATTTHEHTDSRDPSKTINFDENVTIKQNLEGFPVLLLIQFDGTTTPKLIGTYSFNLGRYSYFNMGMSFLKAFSRRSITNPTQEVACPALVDYYEEYGRDETFGDIKLNEIFSYEFDTNADENAKEYPTWSQSDKTILQNIGGFTFNGINPEVSVSDTDAIWEKLESLFYTTATMESTGLNSRGFEMKIKYTFNKDTGKYIPSSTSERYPGTSERMSIFSQYISVNNAAKYFLIANAYGMKDSLGKNLTLRTWNNGSQNEGETAWWVCFYDMDTALGLDNEGAESISETLLIDKYYNITAATSPDQLGIIYHDSASQFGNYNSKLWAILRDDRFLNLQNAGVAYYEPLWTSLRQNENQLISYTSFTSIMESQIAGCGELIYDYDYNSKYLTNDKNISMLHGLRIEYVRNWLKNRLYFLDGVFEDSTVGSVAGFKDSPYYTDSVNITNRGHQENAIGYIPYVLRSTSTIFVKINTGNGEFTNKVIIPAYTDTLIKTKEHTAQKQTNISTSSLLTKLSGLEGIQVVTLNTNNSGRVLPSLTAFNIAGTKYLTTQPLVPKKIFMYDDKSSLIEINLSNTKFGDESAEKNFILDFPGFEKLEKINISNSCVTSIVFPSSVIKELNVTYSNISSFDLSNQPILTSIDLTGCTRLASVKLTNCSALSSVTIDNKSNLNSINISDCSALSSITIENNPALTQITISNNSNLKELTIKNCVNKSLRIEVIGSPLTKITINGLESSNVIKLPAKEYLTGLTLLDLTNDYYIDSIQFGSEEIQTYDDQSGVTHNILDISSLTTLNSENFIIKNCTKLACLRVANNESSPFEIKDNFIDNNKSLIRIFGHISLCTGGIFNGLTEFYLNEPVEKVGGVTPFTEPVFVTGDTGYTNVTINTTDLSNTFAKTKCCLSDVYYILQKCDGVINLGGLFSNCTNVKTDDTDLLNKNTFSHCSSATSIDSIFAECNVAGYLHYDLLKDMVNLETFNYVFGVDNSTITISGGSVEEEYFFRNCSKIKELTGFNPMHSGTQFFDKSLLKGLTSLVKIYRSYCDCEINFYRPGSLLADNPKLKIIKESFLNVKGDTDGTDGPITDLFGYSGDTLETIDKSFTFEGDYNTEFNIGNSFFANAPSIKEIIDGSFTGNKCVKYIDYNDCNEKPFPYDIFKNLTGLTSIENFFSGLMHKDNESPYSATTTILPSEGMFDNCTELTDISGLFSNMSIKYSLAPDGFKYNKITDFGSLFSGSVNRIGFIPYHFFYQEEGNIVENLESCFYGSGSGMTYYTCSDDVLNTYLYKDSDNSAYDYDWNIYIFDGNKDFYKRINTKVGEIKTASGLTEATKYKYIYNDIACYADTEEEVPSGYSYTAVTCYISGSTDNMIFPELPPQFKDGYVHTYDAGTIEREDLIGNNTEAPHRDNVNINDDGLEIFKTVTNYICAPDIFCYCNNSSKLNITGVFDSSSINNSGEISGMYGKIPPFIFRPITEIKSLESIFNGCSGLIPDIIGRRKLGTETEDKIGNIYPVDLFSGLTKVTNISSLFKGNIIWGKCQINSGLFSPFGNKIVNANSLFNNAKWINNVGANMQLPSLVFLSFNNIEDISNMFYRSTIHIDSSLFTYINNPYIKNVSGFMFESSNAYGSVPEFWNNWQYVTTITSCYKDISSDKTVITNTESIPQSYK